jgi:hypothetical protein
MFMLHCVKPKVQALIERVDVTQDGEKKSIMLEEPQ